MQDTRSFFPLYAPSAGTGTGSLLPSTTVAGTTSAVASAQFAGSADRNSFTQIQIANTSAAWAYVNFGNKLGTLTAATVASHYPVAPGAVVVVSVNPEVSCASVILSTGTGNVIFTRGEGI